MNMKKNMYSQTDNTKTQKLINRTQYACCR